MVGLRDRAANLLAAVPTSAEVRRTRRLTLLVPVGIVVWLAYLWPAQALVPWLGWPLGPVVALISTGVALAALAPRAGLALGVAVPLVWAASARAAGGLDDDVSFVLFAWHHHPWIVTLAAMAALLIGREQMTNLMTAPTPVAQSPEGGDGAAGPDRGTPPAAAPGAVDRPGAERPVAARRSRDLMGERPATKASSRPSPPSSSGCRWRASPPSPVSTCRCRTRLRWSRTAVRWPGCSAGWPSWALMALVVGAGVVWLRVRGGLGLGDEPGHTAHAQYSCPSCCSRCCSPASPWLSVRPSSTWSGRACWRRSCWP